MLDEDLLNKYQSLCFIIIAKQEYKIKFNINHYELFQKRSDFEFVIYDGSVEQDQMLTSSNWFLRKDSVQTKDHHIATIVIRKRSIKPIEISDDVLGHLDFNQTHREIRRREIDSMVLNITWLASLCPDDQMLCGGHFETKCYTKEQRCDGKQKLSCLVAF